MKSHTGQSDIIVSEHGYHGNTNICVDISSYKFDGKGGVELRKIHMLFLYQIIFEENTEVLIQERNM